ncbi:hypothetical protein [Halomonas alkalisoli]|uniref:hypothetical protein n=1 Tax=Halomonas alkalisoli TaxID=2907158 RepID=UPI001F18DA7E|nr:hypothetical protein [Halomonas alkalisoli]MCE9684008.1 hypothetical protein [Halomonas alkalisoli]
MQREQVDKELKDSSFEFFYWFSRFEFALKENGFLKDHLPGAKAEPSWEDFQAVGLPDYIASPEACRLMELHPKRQYVSAHGEPEWKRVGVSHCKNDLCRVITMLRTVRNNLFHGGKHGDIDVDSKKRNLELLGCGKVILDQLADSASLTNDYERFY